MYYVLFVDNTLNGHGVNDCTNSALKYTFTLDTFEFSKHVIECNAMTIYKQPLLYTTIISNDVGITVTSSDKITQNVYSTLSYRQHTYHREINASYIII